MILRRASLIAAVLGITACTSADILQLDPTVRPKTAPHLVRLIAQDPGRPYKVVAIVSARGDLESARQRLLKEAAKLGGQAVLLDNSSLTRVGGDETTAQQLTGKVIVYTDSAGSN